MGYHDSRDNHSLIGPVEPFATGIKMKQEINKSMWTKSSDQGICFKEVIK